MKKIILSLALFTLLLALVACGGASNSGDTTNISTSLSLQEELMIGTFKLGATDLAVSSDQAEQLIPLWQTLQSLTTSGTAAAEEINAVVNQIKSTMNSQQIDAIDAMKLTQKDLTALMTENGIASATPATSSTAVASSIQAPGGNAPAGGSINTGASMPGGSGAPSGTGISQAIGQVQAAGSQTGSSQSQTLASTGSASLLSALIEYLQKIVES